MPKNRIIPIFVPHIGCPHQCVFCNQKRITAVEHAMNGSTVKKLVSEGLELAGAGAEVAFYGGSFTAVCEGYQTELLRAVQPFVEKGLVPAIRVSTRPDAIYDAVLMRLTKYGVATVELGCQSMNDTVLQICRRGHTRADVLTAVQKLKQYGLNVILQMMTGLPGDTEAFDLETANALADLAPDGVRIYPTVVVRNTELYDWYQCGLYVPQSVEQAVEQCAQLLSVFIERSIPILRIGLQPTDALSNGGAVAGAYHPALGELVKSRYYRNRAAELLTTCYGMESVVLGVAPNRISIMVGQRKENIKWLQAKFSIKHLKVVSAPVEDWQIILQSAR